MCLTNSRIRVLRFPEHESARPQLTGSASDWASPQPTWFSLPLATPPDATPRLGTLQSSAGCCSLVWLHRLFGHNLTVHWCWDADFSLGALYHMCQVALPSLRMGTSIICWFFNGPESLQVTRDLLSCWHKSTCLCSVRMTKSGLSKVTEKRI